jgi:hypothetical protein
VKITLLIPTHPDNPPFQVRFRILHDHPQSRYGLGVLVDRGGAVLDGYHFRRLRDTIGASIDTTDPAAVRRALGLPADEHLGPVESTNDDQRTFASVLRRLIGPDRGALTRLAGTTSVPYDTLRTYTSGRSLPTVDVMLKICRNLGVSLSVFDGCGLSPEGA